MENIDLSMGEYLSLNTSYNQSFMIYAFSFFLLKWKIVDKKLSVKFPVRENFIPLYSINGFHFFKIFGMELKGNAVRIGNSSRCCKFLSASRRIAV